jgi:hypothetical protein
MQKPPCGKDKTMSRFVYRRPQKRVARNKSALNAVLENAQEDSREARR